MSGDFAKEHHAPVAYLAMFDFLGPTPPISVSSACTKNFTILTQ
jgi:hypothetical protein